MRTAELTPEMQAELDALAALPEDQIDTNDIQEAPLANMMTGERGRYFRPTKTSITIRLDADLVDWFRTKTENGGYQTEINRVLRRHMIETIKNAG
jgi:uncharacterized protein (DUF4415 family)